MGRQVVRKTLEVFECNVCGADGQRYTVLYEDGALVLDRCERHNAKLEKLREERRDNDEWRTNRVGKATFHKSTPDEIRQAMDGQAK